MKIRKFVQLILSAILGLMGCSECAVEEYGCPSADFEMKGKVVNEKGEAMPDVDVSNSYPQSDTSRIYRPVATTNESGEYVVQDDLYNLWEQAEGYSFRFVGDTTKYEPFDTIIPRSSLNIKGGDGDWYQGKASVVVNVTLKEKTK